MKKIDKLKVQVQKYLEEGEEVFATVLGAYESTSLGEKVLRNGIFVATNDRIVFYGKRTIGYDLETFPYSSIQTIQMGKELLGHKCSFHTSVNKVSMKWISHGEVDEFMKQAKEGIMKKNA